MTLLVGFSSTKLDPSGLELAAVLARSSGEDLLVVSVVPAPWPTPTAARTDRDFELWSQERGKAAVEQAEQMLAEHCGVVSARAVAVPGRSVPGTLVEQAQKVGATMIVVGSGQDGSYGRIQVSATADRLVHSSPIPVALAPRGYRAGEVERIGRATCAFRGDDVSRRTLSLTAEVCKDRGASLRVATFAVRGPTMYPPEVGVRAEDMVMETWVEQSRREQRAALAELSEVPDRVETVVASGRDWATAIDSLPWAADDVLVIGSSRAGVVSRLFLGSTATKIVRRSPVPVLVVS